MIDCEIIKITKIRYFLYEKFKIKNGGIDTHYCNTVYSNELFPFTKCMLESQSPKRFADAAYLHQFAGASVAQQLRQIPNPSWYPFK